MAKLPSTSSFPSKESEKNWVNSVILMCQTNSEIEVQPCVFRLSKELKDTKPKAYTPQKMGLGPFHHCQQARNKIAHKISVVKQYLKTNDLQKILDFFKGHSKSFESTIRSCYAAELDLDMETLLLIVIIDTVCLLNFINTYLAREKAKQEPHDHESVRDIMMLENQIPLVLIREVLRNLKQMKLAKEDDLFDKYYSFCSILYPVKLANVRESMKKEFSKTQHLLHFMHQLIVGKTILDLPAGEFSRSHHDPDIYLRYALKECKKLAKKTIKEITELVDKAKSERVRTPSFFDWIGNPLKALNFSKKEPEATDKILSASDIHQHHIRLSALDVGQGFGSFKFDQLNKIIHVPVMILDENTEVILRNLLAYEAAVQEDDLQEAEDDVGVSEVKDHMGLMCAITKTDGDVEQLKKWKIIETEMSNNSVVEIFQGLKQCMEKQHLKSNFLDLPIPSEDSDINPKLKSFFAKLNAWIEAFFKLLKRVFPTLVVLLLFFQYYLRYTQLPSPLVWNPFIFRLGFTS